MVRKHVPIDSQHVLQPSGISQTSFCLYKFIKTHQKSNLAKFRPKIAKNASNYRCFWPLFPANLSPAHPSRGFTLGAKIDGVSGSSGSCGGKSGGCSLGATMGGGQLWLLWGQFIKTAVITSILGDFRSKFCEIRFLMSFDLLV